jgi:hypothetical protein
MDLRIVWLAGLLEGEGSFRTRGKTSPIIQLTMCDEDTVERAAHLMDSHVSYRRTLPSGKTAYHVTVGGQRAAIIMENILPMMSGRRAAKIVEILEKWKTGRGPKTVISADAKLAMREAHEMGFTGRQLARIYHLGDSTVSRVLHPRVQGG